ncbi:MAG: hypothetical protein R2932_11565 [Caldilineaceae bacterium]
MPPCQQTLSNAIAWSYRLLDADAQSAFRQLGILWVALPLMPLGCLWRRSLYAGAFDWIIVCWRAPERWQMLVMIREFALAQMGSAEWMATQQSYIAYFVAQPTTNSDTVAPDNANFCAALLQPLPLMTSMRP